MNTTQKLLAEAKQALQIESDYALAKALKMSRQAISHYRTGRSQLDVEGAFQVAEILHREPAAIIAAVEAERATKPEAREAWLLRLKQLGGVAAGVMVFCLVALPAPAEAAQHVGRAVQHLGANDALQMTIAYCFQKLIYYINYNYLIDSFSGFSLTLSIHSRTLACRMPSCRKRRHGI